MEKDIGPCKAIIPKYFFNSKTQTCEQFDFGGCQGNENRFDSLDECNKECSSLKLDKTVQGIINNLFFFNFNNLMEYFFVNFSKLLLSSSRNRPMQSCY
jgi:hypothetical protein